MDYKILNTLLQMPEYLALSDIDAATALNTVNLKYDLESLKGYQLINAQDDTEYIALSDAKKAQWLSLCALETIDPFGTAVDVVKDIWGSGSMTVSNLNLLRRETVSRAARNGLPEVNAENVRYARTL